MVTISSIGKWKTMRAITMMFRVSGRVAEFRYPKNRNLCALPVVFRITP